MTEKAEPRITAKPSFFCPLALFFQYVLHEAKYGWREYCLDGPEFDIDPENFEPEAEYDEAVGAATEEKYAWREHCENGDKFYVCPEDFETKKEYEAALNEVRYTWRKYCEDGSEYNVDSGEYETKEEYEAALLDAKYGWRNDFESDPILGTNSEDYEFLPSQHIVSPLRKWYILLNGEEFCSLLS